MRPRRSAFAHILALVFAAGPSAAAESDWDLWAFRIPDHRWYTLRLSGQANASGGELNATGFESEATQAAGLLNGLYVLGRDGERLQSVFQVSGDAFAIGSWSNTHDQFFSPPAVSDRRRNNDASQVANDAFVSERVRWYPLAVPVGIQTSVAASALYTHMSQYEATVQTTADTATQTRNETTIVQDHWERQYAGTWEATALVGRVRDATSVYVGWLMEERLRRDGLLARPLSEAGRRRLIDLLYVRGSYSFAHDFSDKFFWSDVEKVLREDGALNEAGFDAYGLLHALQPVVPTLLQRNAGYAIGPTVLVEYIDQRIQDSLNQHVVSVFDTSRSEITLENHSDLRESNTDLLAGGFAEAHQPLGLRGQFDASASALFDTEDPQDRSLITGRARLSWIVAERWYASTGFSYRRERRPSLERWAAAESGSVEYFLEDHVTVELGLTLSQTEEDESGFVVSRRSTSATLGISYRFGGLYVPNVVDPVRPMTPGPGY